MSAPLKTYRIYCFDQARKIVTAEFLDASSDEDAIAQAEALGYGNRCEIWHDRRMVAQLGEVRQQA